MPTSRFLASLLAAALLGGAVGWALRPAQPRTAAPPAGEPSAAARALPTEPVRSAAERTPATVDQAFECLVAPPAAKPREPWLCLARLPPTELGGLHARMAEFESSPEGGGGRIPVEGWSFLLARLAVYEPTRALELAQQRSAGGNADEPVLTAVFRQLAWIEPTAVEAWLQRQTPLRKSAWQRIWLEVLRSERPALLPERLGDAWDEESVVAIFAALAERSIPTALRELARLPSAHLRTKALELVLEAWAARDAKAATAWLQAQPGLRKAAAHWERVLQKRARHDPRGAADAAAAVTEFDRTNLLKTVLRTWGQQDLAAARSWIAQRPPAEQSSLLVELLPVWVQTDPSAALTYALVAARGYEQKHAAIAALRSWRTSDLAGAEKWLRSLPAADREVGLGWWAESLGTNRPEELRVFLGLLGEAAGGLTGAKARHRDTALRALARSDADQALAWADAQPAGERPALLRTVIQGLAQANPERAAGLLARLPTEARSREGSPSTALYQRIGSAWAAQNPAAAAAWAATVPDRLGRLTALDGVAQEWAQREPEAAWRWAMSLPPGIRPEGTRAVADYWAQADPATALAAVRQLPPDAQAGLLPPVLAAYADIAPLEAAAAAAQLPEGPSRRATFARVAGAWLQRDRAGALRWIEQHRSAFDPVDLQRLEGR